MQRRMSNRERIDRLRAEADAAAKERAAKPKAAPKSRAAAAKAPPGRVRLFWMVCGPSGKEVTRFPYAQEEQARADAVQRTESTGQTHFVTKAETPVP